MNEVDSKTMIAIRSIPTTTRTWLGGFRFDCAQDDDKFYTELMLAKEIVTNNRSKKENDPKEVDNVEEVEENEDKLDEKDALFRDVLILLLGHIDVKTTKVDDLLTKLKEMK